jgi:transcriptional regulator with XRE-family HTH domain
MRTLEQLATTLRQRIKRLKVTQEALSEDAGISRQTLSKVLSARADLKVTTLFAIADRLGFEVLLVPKEVAPGMMSVDEPEAHVKSVVDAALERSARTR